MSKALTHFAAICVNGERRASFGNLLPAVGRHVTLSARIARFSGNGGDQAVGAGAHRKAIAREGGVRWIWKRSSAREDGAGFVWFFVTVIRSRNVMKPATGENGQRNKGESKSEFHLWGCLAAAVMNILYY
jgi:hypothetical protein